MSASRTKAIVRRRYGRVRDALGLLQQLGVIPALK